MTDILGIIKTQREARGWSEYQLAERSGLPQSTISSWYKKDMTPSFASLEKICDAFGITLSQFFADGEESVVLTPSQRKMLDKWNCLTEAQQNEHLQTGNLRSRFNLPKIGRVDIARLGQTLTRPPPFLACRIDSLSEQLLIHGFASDCVLSAFILYAYSLHSH